MLAITEGMRQDSTRNEQGHQGPEDDARKVHGERCGAGFLIDRIAHGSEIQFLIPGLRSERHPDLAVVFPRRS